MQILFADFVLDVEARTLRHRGAAVLLRPKEFDLLLLLATSRGRTVGKDAIVDAVWKNAEVSDAALSQCVYRLRRALAAHDPLRHIVTAPGRGYRFTPGVTIRAFDLFKASTF